MDAHLQPVLAAALLDPAHALPPGVDAGAFAVHRNTATVGLRDALRERFPSTRKLLGDEAFDVAAIRFLREAPPASPVLHEWGEDFPAALAHMPGMEDWAWIADVARLESARVTAWHAADAPRDDHPEAAASMARAARRLGLHPSTRTLACHSPALAIWQSQNGLGEPPRPEAWHFTEILVWRRDEAVLARPMDAGQRLLFDAARRGETIGLLRQHHHTLDPILIDALDAGWLVSRPSPIEED